MFNMRYINHYTQGSFKINHLGKEITVSDSTALSIFISTLQNLEVDVITIAPGYEHRPDRISELFYETPTKDWLIMMFNNIKDPFQGLNVGDTLLLPKL